MKTIMMLNQISKENPATKEQISKIKESVNRTLAKKYNGGNILDSFRSLPTRTGILQERDNR